MKRTSHFARVLKLKKPFRSPAHEASIAILSTASCLKNGLERIAKSQGISLSQFNILRILRGEDGPLPTMEVADRMVEMEPGVTRLMGKLEQNGFITRNRSDADARMVVCTITDKGKALLANLDENIARFEEQLMTAVHVEELGQLSNIMSRIHCQASKDADPAEV